MALGDAYASVANLEARLGKTDDGSFTRLLQAASRHVEWFTGRQFNKTDTASERRFRALDVERLPVDDFHSLTDLAVEVDGTAWAADDYDPRPWNGVVNGEQGWPFFDLLAVDRYWPIKRRATVYVTARWGWAAVPAGIVEATLGVASSLATFAGVTGSLGTGELRSETVEGWSVSYDNVSIAAVPGVPSALAPAMPYRRKRFGVA